MPKVTKKRTERSLVKQEDLRPKIVVISGVTASGKTGLGVRLAYSFSGEIISADSRQVYSGMDIGTGKDLPDYRYKNKDIPYHLIDVASPRQPFNLSRYLKLAVKSIDDIIARGKLPIIVGGSGLYVQAIVDNYELAGVRSKRFKRDKIESLGAEKLYKKLEDINPEFAHRLNNSDRNNARRLSRYLEIASEGEIVQKKKINNPYNFLVIATEISDAQMRENITLRLDQRLKDEALINEVKSLHESGISYKRLISFGLEYKYVSLYLQKKLSEEEMREKLIIAIYRFAKKQKTWFKRFEKQGQKINYVINYKEMEILVKNYLAK